MTESPLYLAVFSLRSQICGFANCSVYTEGVFSFWWQEGRSNAYISNFHSLIDLGVLDFQVPFLHTIVLIIVFQTIVIIIIIILKRSPV